MLSGSSLRWHGVVYGLIVVFPDHTHFLFLISGDANLVFYLSVYPVFLQTSDYDVILILRRFSVIGDVIHKVQRHHGLIKTHAVR